MAVGKLLHDKVFAVIGCISNFYGWRKRERERGGEGRENGRMERRDVESNDLILTDYRYLFWNQK